MEQDWTRWLEQLNGFGNQKMAEIGFFDFLLLMMLSLACALFVSYLYLTFYRNRATGSQIHRAFPLLGISITAIFISIQFSLPLSLGLLGALSIVRFRTPVKEPEEIGFIMVVVATSLSCATFNLTFLAIILFTVVVALLVLRFGRTLLGPRKNDGMFVITVPMSDYSAKGGELLGYLEKTFPAGRLDSITEGGDDATVTYSFVKLRSEALPQLRHDLSQIAERAQANVFFNRSSEV